MRLAETIVITLAGQSLELRPTLRAAVVLERAHGLADLGGKLVELHVTAIADTIAATAFGPWSSDEVAGLMIPGGIAANAMRLAPDLLELVEGLVGIDPDAEESEEKPASDPMTIAEAQRSLFRIATGKLGWSPAEAWGSTPLEILEAWRGRCELLRDIFGGGEEAPKGKSASLDDKFAALLARNATLRGATVA